MQDTDISNIPAVYSELLAKADEIGFNMPSDVYIGSLLKTLITSKPKSRFLELGTGVGLSLSWMIAGMDTESTIISIDNDPSLVRIARSYLGQDERVHILCEDGKVWLNNFGGEKFDLIFADAWPGKYSELEIALHLLNSGGFYIIDDMKEQANWPVGHAAKASQLICDLENRTDLTLTKLNWSTGIIIATKK
ncbi:MAG: class I SAM-dependent methyltransferase [Bacteroidota bacterium]